MLTLLSINWNPNPELFNLFGSLPIRYYGLLWVVGIALAYVIVHRQYHDRKIDEKTFEPLFFYCFFGILVGARLGHCLFYQPDYYLNHFWEMILPVKFLPDGGWKFTGYEGLASHGGTLGLIIALWMYCRKTKMHYMDVLDMIADGKETIIGSSMFPAFEKYYMPELADKYSQDTAKAKELLAEVGFPDGFDMTITVPSNYQ